MAQHEKKHSESVLTTNYCQYESIQRRQIFEYSSTSTCLTCIYLRHIIIVEIELLLCKIFFKLQYQIHEVMASTKCSKGARAHLGEAERDFNLHHVVVPAVVNVPPAWAVIQWMDTDHVQILAY